MPRVTQPGLELESVLIAPRRTPVPGHGKGGGPRNFDPRGGRGGGGDGDHNDGHRPLGTFRVGMWSTLASITVLFVALVAAYLAHSRKPEVWADFEVPHILYVSTALIVASSLACEAARRSLRLERERRFSFELALAALLAVGFLAAQLQGWRELVLHGVYLTENPRSSFFYLFTGLHGIHLLVGLMAIAVLFVRNRALSVNAYSRAQRLELTGIVTLYWHFLGTLWIVLFWLLLYR